MSVISSPLTADIMTNLVCLSSLVTLMGICLKRKKLRLRSNGRKKKVVQARRKQLANHKGNFV